MPLRLVEVEVAGIVAFTTGTTVKRPLEKLVGQMEAHAAAGELFDAERLAFHCGLADLCHNRVLGGLVRQLWTGLAARSWDRNRRVLARPGDLLREAAFHRKVLLPLREGLAPQTRLAMKHYFDWLEEIWDGEEWPASEPDQTRQTM